MLNQAESFIKELILSEGAMPLSKFWDIALCHPDFGYYSSRDPLGVDGDFVTAPEVSQMFGEMVGAWIVDIWRQMGTLKSFDLIECGPGRGTLMADILRVGRQAPDFLETMQIRFIESSPVLRKAQEDAIQNHPASWHSDLDEVDANSPSILIGNEFLDALPVEQLKRTESGWKQRYIDWCGDGFCDIWQEPLNGSLLDHLPLKTISGKVYEVSPARADFLKKSMERIKTHNGIILFIDYGHADSHYGDTVQAIAGHEYADVLKNISNHDITAHVDFEALKRCAQENGFKASACVAQGAFLRNLGIEYRAQVLKNSALKRQSITESKQMHASIDKALKRLLSGDEMGALFKVMCFYNDDTIRPVGFEG